MSLSSIDGATAHKARQWGPMFAEQRETVPSVYDIWAHDAVGPPPAILSAASDPQDLGVSAVDKARFISPEFHALEVERLWKRVWQMACRESAVSNVGDFVTYDIADQSVIIVRESPDRVAAYHNVCQHRGNRLVHGSGNVGASGTFQCSFHAWTWNTDGTLARVPCQWDFPQVQSDEYALKPVRVDAWDGWVFVNLDPGAEPLADFLGEAVVEHFKLWPMAERYVAAHVGKIVPCNWKIVMEAFMETWHVFQVHPQALPGGIDSGTQYDHWGLHSRMIEIIGMPSADLDPGAYTEQEVVDAMIEMAATAGALAGEIVSPEVAAGSTARATMAAWNRAQLQAASDRDFSAVSDAEILDVIEYVIFPNFIPWGGFGSPIVYRSRPYGDDAQRCFFETMLLAPASSARPPDAPLHMLEPNQTWTDAPELGGLGAVLAQDDANLAGIQLGLHSDGLSGVSYSQYQESNIRNLHRGIERFVGRA